MNIFHGCAAFAAKLGKKWTEVLLCRCLLKYPENSFKNALNLRYYYVRHLIVYFQSQNDGCSEFALEFHEKCYCLKLLPNALKFCYGCPEFAHKLCKNALQFLV